MKPSEIARIVIAAAWGAALVGSIAMKGYALTTILSGAVILPAALVTALAAMGSFDD
jgi:hypothetical protein